MRRDARKIAFSLIYEYLFTNEKDDLSLEQFIKKEDADDTVFEITGSDKAFIVDIYNNVVNNLDVYRKKVAALAEGFKEERLFKVDLAILRMAFYEIDTKSTPIEVVINEAVGLAKTYSTDNSAGFINGILAQYVKDKDTKSE